jgi:hypothetical protein
MLTEDPCSRQIIALHAGWARILADSLPRNPEWCNTGHTPRGKQHTQKMKRQHITFRTRLKRLAKLSQRNSNLTL